MAQKKVFDGDLQKCLEVFDESQTEERLAYYQSLGKWDEVLVDSDGDIVLYENE